MPEQSPIEQGGNEIKLPSKLRIQQRLGHVSTNKAFKANVVKPLMQLGGEMLAPDSVVESVGRITIQHACIENMNQVNYAQYIVPKILNQLAEGDQERLSMSGAYGRWLESLPQD